MSMVTRKLKWMLLYLVDDVMVAVVVQVRLCSSMVEDTTLIGCDVMMILPLIVVDGGDYFHYDYDHRPS